MSTIILCDNCNANGKIRRSELEDYHRGEYNVWHETCNKCDGSGRVIKTVTVTYKPFFFKTD